MSDLYCNKAVMDLFKLDGRVALVTGGGQGLGEAMATALAQAGSAVAVIDINFSNAAMVADKIKASGGNAIPVKCDVTQSDQVEAAFSDVARTFGRIDIAVNNAGITLSGPAEDMSDEDWKRIVDINLNGVFLCAREAGKHMIRQGTGGSIINTASMSGTIINKGFYLAGYCTTKAGVKHLTKALAVEWAKYGIRVNSISPGYMRTPLIAASLAHPEIVEEKMVNTTPLGRLGEPQDLAGPILFLASDASLFVTGHDLVVDGGHTAW